LFFFFQAWKKKQFISYFRKKQKFNGAQIKKTHSIKNKEKRAKNKTFYFYSKQKKINE
jgi:hypothetical protein